MFLSHLFSSSIMNHRQMVGFIEHFAKNDNWHELNKDEGDLGYGWLHYSLIRLLKPSRVLCIGSKYGYIPAVCALACRDNKKGKVDFVDAAYDEKKHQDNNRSWAGVGFWKTSQGKKQFKKFGLDDFIDFHLESSQKFFENNSDKKWSYVHLDGDHSYQGMKADFQKAWPRIHSGGYLALHDIYLSGTHGRHELEYEVPLLWQELSKNSDYKTMEFPGNCGLGLIQK